MDRVEWSYEITKEAEDRYIVTYTSDQGDLIPSNIVFDTEELAHTGAVDYIETLEELYNQEWQ